VTQTPSWITLLSFGDQGWGDELIYGAGLSLAISVVSYLIGLFLGLLGAIAKLSRNSFAAAVASGYTTVIRAVPEILLILLIYYTATSSIRDAANWIGFAADFQVNGFLAAALSLGVVQGGYSTEVFRGAIVAVERGQTEAAKSLGLTQSQTFVLVILPQMLRHALPGLGNLWLVVLKESSLISIIGFTELLLVGKMAAGATHDYFFFFSVVAMIFLVLSGISAALFHLAERRSSLAWRR
jgi:polar amino acid transport system permease protein